MKKKIKLTKGLSVNKEALTKLQESQMAKLVAGKAPDSVTPPSSAGDTCYCKNSSC